MDLRAEPAVRMAEEPGFWPVPFQQVGQVGMKARRQAIDPARDGRMRAVMGDDDGAPGGP